MSNQSTKQQETPSSSLPFPSLPSSPPLSFLSILTLVLSSFLSFLLQILTPPLDSQLSGTGTRSRSLLQWLKSEHERSPSQEQEEVGSVFEGGRSNALTCESQRSRFEDESLRNTHQPTPLLSPPLSSNTLLPTNILPARTQASSSNHHHHVVPLLTPDSSPTNTPSYIQSARPHVSLTALPSSSSSSQTTQKTHTSFLESLFPKHAQEASKVSQSVLITSNASSVSWSGALLDAPQVPGSPTLLVSVPMAEGVEIREHVEILLDLAFDSLNCSTLVFVLDKSSPDLRELVHGLLFIGGTIVRPDARSGWEWEVDEGKVLIGMEL
ncbi:hypothetical protein BDY24DRAFT_191979 [Mrakia frigida]|uniref:uncharacterized protein n=1 Tax=Mrakia frigida TaxID=29902 RepID=UPI003FCC091D